MKTFFTLMLLLIGTSSFCQQSKIKLSEKPPHFFQEQYASNQPRTEPENSFSLTIKSDEEQELPAIMKQYPSSYFHIKGNRAINYTEELNKEHKRLHKPLPKGLACGLGLLFEILKGAEY